MLQERKKGILRISTQHWRDSNFRVKFFPTHHKILFFFLRFFLFLLFPGELLVSHFHRPQPYIYYIICPSTFSVMTLFTTNARKTTTNHSSAHSKNTTTTNVYIYVLCIYVCQVYLVNLASNIYKIRAVDHSPSQLKVR